MIKKIVFSLVIGFVASIYMLQHDPAIKQILQNQCKLLLENAICCKMQFTLSSFDLLSRHLELHNIITGPNDDAPWGWHCNRAVIHFSLWELITHKKLGMHITFEELAAQTTVTDNVIAIIPHIQQAIIGLSFDAPVILRSIIFKRATLAVNEAQGNYQAALAWKSSLHFSADHVNAHFECTDGSFTCKSKKYCDTLHGTVTLELPYDLMQQWSLALNLQGHVPQVPLPGTNCCCIGSINNNQGAFTLRTIDNSICIDPLTVSLSTEQKTLKATMQFPLDAIKYFVQSPYIDKLSGSCTIQAHYGSNATHSTLEGLITGSTIRYNNNTIAEKCKLSFALNDQNWSGKISARSDNHHAMHGTWAWQTNQRQGTITLSNNKQLSDERLPAWVIGPDQAKIALQFNDQLIVNGSYKANLENHKTANQTTINGSFHLDPHEISIDGTAADIQYLGIFSISPMFGIKKFTCRKSNEQEFIALQGRSNDYQRFTGQLCLSCINAFAQACGYPPLQGEGQINLAGVLKNDKLLLKTSFKNGTIRLPQTYNCIHSLDALATIDWINKYIIINQLNCSLYEGSCHAQHAFITLNEQWQPEKFYLPLLLDHCLLNIKRDFFAVVSGNLLFEQHEQQTALLKGHLMLNRSQLADNIFSGSFHETLAQYTKDTVSVHDTEIQSDITIETQQPIRIKNSFFDTKARVNLHIMGKIHAPSLAGSITLNGGNLLFPYKPLIITKGNLMLHTQHLDDPIIEINAKNKIKKYIVSLSVTGSLKHHQINFSSTPPLSEEQIITLLLLGFEEASLSSVAPALVMNNFTNLLFGSDPTSFFQRLLANLPESFKKVHFIPSFNDQSGRGGLRGNIEIDINDRWHASVQKNFNLSEDTRFELEYLLSDDISLKGTRDEHRDISGEVEMRFKF